MHIYTEIRVKRFTIFNDDLVAVQNDSQFIVEETRVCGTERLCGKSS